MDGWNTSFLLGWPIYVSFRECNFQGCMCCEATHLEANLVRLNAAMSACQMLGVSWYQLGVEPRYLNFGAGNV